MKRFVSCACTASVMLQRIMMAGSISLRFIASTLRTLFLSGQDFQDYQDWFHAVCSIVQRCVRCQMQFGSE